MRTWVTVRDTREQAFSVDVPQGWTVRGGMFRLALLSPRAMVDMTSPDGKIHIRIGDNTIPDYTLANPVLARMGLTEGKIMPVNGAWPIIARFRPAHEYVATYAPRHFGPLCDSLKTTNIRAVEPRINKKAMPGGQTTAAEGFFTCTVNGEPMVAYVYSETWATAMIAGGFWNATTIGTFLAPAAQAAAAGEILTESWKTFAFNPAWFQFYTQQVNNAARMSSTQLYSTLRQMQTNSNAASNYAMRAQQQQADTFSDILTGTTLTADRITGQVREVPSGFGGTQWINSRNQVVESALSPGAGFHELQNISR